MVNKKEKPTCESGSRGGILGIGSHLVPWVHNEQQQKRVERNGAQLREAGAGITVGIPRTTLLSFKSPLCLLLALWP